MAEWDTPNPEKIKSLGTNNIWKPLINRNK